MSVSADHTTTHPATTPRTQPEAAGGTLPIEGARLPAWAWALAGLGLAMLGITVAARFTGHIGVAPAETWTWVIAVVGLPIGARVASYAPRNACGWLLLGAGLCGATAVVTSLASNGPALWLTGWVYWPAVGLLATALLLYPDGRLPSRRWLPALAVLAGAILVGSLALAIFSFRVPGALARLASSDVGVTWDLRAFAGALLAFFVGAVLAVAAVVSRLRRAAPAERGPLLWGAAGALLLVVSVVLDVTVGVPLTWLGLVLALPAATAVGVLRYGLYDIDLLIHRSLANALLIAGVMAVYVTAIEVATYVVPVQAEALAAAAAAIAVLPLERTMRGGVRRWLYGQSSRPQELFSDLSRRIGVALTPEEVLGAVVTTVSEGLRVPYVAVRLCDQEQPETEHGRRRPWDVTALALAHRGEVIGELVVQQRAPDEPWSRRENQLLAALAAQVGPSAAAVRLTRALQAARERLVKAREEERRRLRNDLHDGVGPTLTGARMQARACLSATDNNAVAAALQMLDSDLGSATAEVRRIVDGLRPAALDRGLTAALEGICARYAASLDVTLSTDGPATESPLADLPAAVEVAVYRVVDEALANVVKHAGAQAAQVRIGRHDSRWLVVEIADDGVGYRGPRDGGVGMSSMAERCTELGGTFGVAAEPPGTPGTRLTARIPLW